MKNLTREQSELLIILEAFMHNRTYEVRETEGQFLEDILKLAQKHKVSSVVYEKLHTSVQCPSQTCKNLLEIWKKYVIREVMFQIQRTEGFLNVYEKLLEVGITPLVVKGIICRNLYSKSDYRISGDEDLLLSKEQFELCDKIFLEDGFQRERIDRDSLPQEIAYINPQNGVYIELHLMLFPAELGSYEQLNDEFLGVHERRVCEEIQGKKIWTLGPTDHMFYLICHSFKHFLHSGFGIRQVCDMVMMAEHYGKEIDWESILGRLERLNMKKYWDALLKIGVIYLGFSLEKAAYPIENYDNQIDCEPFLLDLLDSGVYGDSSLERKHSSNMTLSAVAMGKSDMKASILASLFPKKSYMQQQYTWTERYPWLLPISYVLRIVRYLKERGKQSNSEENSIQIGANRIELLKKYNIIE